MLLELTNFGVGKSGNLTLPSLKGGVMVFPFSAEYEKLPTTKERITVIAILPAPVADEPCTVIGVDKEGKLVEVYTSSVFEVNENLRPCP